MSSTVGSLHTTVEDRLRRVGQRYTASRRSLVEVLSVANGPLSIADLLAVTSEVPQSSAYRNLAVLEEADVVRRVITEDDFARFELDEGLTEHHHHLVCSNCGRVEDVEIPDTFERSIDRTLERLARDAGFATIGHRLDLIGKCRSCA
ncbi:MAG TPA: transcriptional repressor [Actinomycetota bacterium]|nr:transcriptional repressor [Actinomycetota bacterium]